MSTIIKSLLWKHIREEIAPSSNGTNSLCYALCEFLTYLFFRIEWQQQRSIGRTFSLVVWLEWASHQRQITRIILNIAQFDIQFTSYKYTEQRRTLNLSFSLPTIYSSTVLFSLRRKQINITIIVMSNADKD